MKTFLKTVCVLCLPFLFVACSDDEDSLPPITQTGENTFGCLLNGNLYVADRGEIRADIVSGGEEFGGNALIISGGRNDEQLRIAIFDPSGDLELRNYELTFQQMNSLRGVEFRQWFDGVTCPLNGFNYDILSGSMSLTKIDIKNRIVSGTFQFSLRHHNGCAEDIIATEGRFDIRNLLY